MSFSFTGPVSSTELRKKAEDDIEPLLTSVTGVASVDIFGGTTREIDIELDKEMLKARSVDISTIMGVFKASNINYPVGQVRGTRKNTVVRTAGKFENLEQMRDMDIPTGTGVIKLGEIAKVKDTIKTITSASRYNGINSVSSTSRSVPTRTWSTWRREPSPVWNRSTRRSPKVSKST